MKIKELVMYLNNCNPEAVVKGFTSNKVAKQDKDNFTLVGISQSEDKNYVRMWFYLPKGTFRK